MSDYGVLPTGFVVKPLSVILAELEAKNISGFGPGVIQTEQSPLGQWNGLRADLIAELWEHLLNTYQSYDPDNAEGTRLETLARIRLLERSAGETDGAFRKAITNIGRGRIDIADAQRTLLNVSGVTYARVYLNDTTTTDEYGLEPGVVAVVAIGGDDEEIAHLVRQYTVPGVILYGNTTVSSVYDGYCRTIPIVRPLVVNVDLDITVYTRRDALGCPPPAPTAIAAWLVSDLANVSSPRLLNNGDAVSLHRIRSSIEGNYPHVEVVSFIGSRDQPDTTYSTNVEVPISFVEIANLRTVTVHVDPDGEG